MSKLIGTALSSAMALTCLSGLASAEGKIAYFAAASQNGFNQATYVGVEEMAAKLGYEA